MTEEYNETLNETSTERIAASSYEPATIGELLRSKREEKGLNLKTISQQTKIHIGLLEHLEKDELDKLPSKTYVKGFVKSAAKILGLDQDYTLNLLEATYNRSKPSLKEKIKESKTEMTAMKTSTATDPLETVKSVTASSTAFLAKITVAVLILGVIGFNIKNLIDRSEEENQKLPTVLSTIHQKDKETKPKETQPKEAPQTETAKTDEQIQVNLIDGQKLPQKSEIVINDITLRPISLGEKQFSEDNSLTKDQYDEYLPGKNRVQVIKGMEAIFINAVDGDSWITYKVDDKDIKKFVLRQGRTIFLRGETIRLFFGNTKVLRVFYNNKHINLNSKTGVKNLVIPEEQKIKYMNPLFVFLRDGSVVTSDDYIKNNENVAPPMIPGNPTAIPAKPAPAAKPATP